MGDILGNNRFLAVSFGATVLLTMAMTYVHHGLGVPLLDFVFSGDRAIAAVQGMTLDDKFRHVLTTTTLDTLYPLAYGSLLAGLIGRFATGWGGSLIWLPVLAVGFDIVENALQVLALAFDPTLLTHKFWLTGPKFVFVGAAIVAAVYAIWLHRRKTAKDT